MIRLNNIIESFYDTIIISVFSSDIKNTKGDVVYITKIIELQI